jgi:hypothetical protein
MKYHVTWTERNTDGTITTEGLSVGAGSAEDAEKQVRSVANVIEIKSVSRV